jgi:hypothetical protein
LNQKVSIGFPSKSVRCFFPDPIHVDRVIVFPDPINVDLPSGWCFVAPFQRTFIAELAPNGQRLGPTFDINQIEHF